MSHYAPNQPFNRGSFIEVTRIFPEVPRKECAKDDERVNMLTFDSGTQFTLRTTKYGDVTFLTELSQCQPIIIAKNEYETWERQNKHTAQDILPFLFLGPMTAARDPNFIKSNGITMLLAVRDGKAASVNPRIMDPERYVGSQNLETAVFDVLDEFDLVRSYHSSIKLMIEHIKAKTLHRPVRQLSDVGGRILVFCEAGDRRSAALVVLFIMVVFGLPATDAIQAVQARRYCSTISGDLQRMIRVCDDILHAERKTTIDSANSRPAGINSLGQMRKRGLDADLEDDFEDEGFNDELDLLRIGTAPFVDI